MSSPEANAGTASMQEPTRLIDYPELVSQARERIKKLEIAIEDVLSAATDFVRPCKACGVKLWFVRSVTSDKLIPFTVDGTNHFRNCTNPNRFSKKKAAG